MTRCPALRSRVARESMRSTAMAATGARPSAKGIQIDFMNDGVPVGIFNQAERVREGGYVADHDISFGSPAPTGHPEGPCNRFLAHGRGTTWDQVVVKCGHPVRGRPIAVGFVLVPGKNMNGIGVQLTQPALQPGLLRRADPGGVMTREQSQRGPRSLGRPRAATSSAGHGQALHTQAGANPYRGGVSVNSWTFG